MRRWRVSGFFALSMARTCSRFRLWVRPSYAARAAGSASRARAKSSGTFTAGGSVLSSLVKARKDGNPSLDNVEVLAPEPSTRVTGGVIGNPGGPRGW